MRPLVVAVVWCGFAGSADAQERFVERTPLPRQRILHTPQRAGNSASVKPHAIPSVTPHDVGGYVGAARLLGNNVLARGPVATGAVATGTFGTDYAGLQVRPNRVFLAPCYDPSVGPTIARAYRTDGPHVPDVFSLRPVRKAVIEAKEPGHE